MLILDIFMPDRWPHRARLILGDLCVAYSRASTTVNAISRPIDFGLLQH